MPRPDFAVEERLMQQIDREGRGRTELVKQMARDAGRPELAEDPDRNLRDIEAGVSQARAIWHSISDPQRRVLEHLVKRTGTGRLVIAGDGRLVYFVDPPGVPLPKPAGLATVRNLAARGLLDWDGGAFKPEWAAIANERARFVLKHGRPEPGQHFEGYRP